MEGYRVLISAKAKQQIGRHVRFLSNVSVNAARELKERFVKDIQALAFMPGRYPYFTEAYIPAYKYHKMVIDERFLVLYQIKGETVYVEYVIDCREDYDWLLG